MGAAEVQLTATFDPFLTPKHVFNAFFASVTVQCPRRTKLPTPVNKPGQQTGTNQCKRLNNQAKRPHKRGPKVCKRQQVQRIPTSKWQSHLASRRRCPPPPRSGPASLPGQHRPGGSPEEPQTKTSRRWPSPVNRSCCLPCSPRCMRCLWVNWSGT